MYLNYFMYHISNRDLFLDSIQILLTEIPKLYRRKVDWLIVCMLTPPPTALLNLCLVCGWSLHRLPRLFSSRVTIDLCSECMGVKFASFDFVLFTE